MTCSFPPLISFRSPRKTLLLPESFEVILKGKVRQSVHMMSRSQRRDCQEVSL